MSGSPSSPQVRSSMAARGTLPSRMARSKTVRNRSRASASSAREGGVARSGRSASKSSQLADVSIGWCSVIAACSSAATRARRLSLSGGAWSASASHPPRSNPAPSSTAIGAPFGSLAFSISAVALGGSLSHPLSAPEALLLPPADAISSTAPLRSPGGGTQAASMTEAASSAPAALAMSSASQPDGSRKRASAPAARSSRQMAALSRAAESIRGV